MYKTLKAGMKSEHGKCKWEIGKWKKVGGITCLCSEGFHCSGRIINAMRYVSAEIIAEVEVRGNSMGGNDKSVHQEMRIIKAWEWTKGDSVALAIYAAEKVIKNYESKYPEDERPRQAIRAAKRGLKNPTEENRKAAFAAAFAAYAAYAYAYAYAADYAAAYAAYAAAYAAYAVASDAAYAVASDSAYAAAYAASEKTLDQIETWIRRRLRNKEMIGRREGD